MLALSPQALSDNGVLAFQLQSMNTITEFFSPMKDFAAVVTRLEALGFESIVDYSDAHANPDYMKPLSFVIALKNRDNLGNFFMNQAEQSMQISKRTIQKATGESPFVYFDGASMMPYQFTSRIVENLWCSLRNDDYCRKGHGYNPELTNFPISAFSVKESTVANGGRGVFASEFIPKASFIGLEDVANFIYLPSSSFDVLTRTANVVNESISEFWSTVYWGYFEGYGWDFSGWVGTAALE